MHYSVQATSRIKRCLSMGYMSTVLHMRLSPCEFPLYGALPYFLKYGAPLELCP